MSRAGAGCFGAGACGEAADPADWVTSDESLSMASLVLLEAMTPAQRVALILHDVFEYSFPEVAAVTGRTPAARRELASTPSTAPPRSPISSSRCRNTCTRRPRWSNGWSTAAWD
jgi:hypothetical protein